MKKDKLMIFTFASLALSLVSTITYMVYTIINNGSFINHVVSTIGVIVLVVFSIFLVVTGFFIENKKAKIFIIIAALLLTIYSMTQTIISINKPIDTLPDFTNYNIDEVVKWAKDNKIDLEKEYMYSDEIEAFHIISQSVKKGTDIRKIKELKVVISTGIDKTKITKVDNMIGWKLDDVVAFIDENKLTNVTINFEFSNTVEKDVIISQDIVSEITRNEPITLVSSLGKESNQKSVVLDNIVGLDLFHAKVYLGRNNIKYSIIYEYSDKKEDTVLNQSIKQYTVISNNKKQEMVITVAKKEEVTVPDIKNMTIDEIDKWALNNKIIVEYDEKFDDSVTLDKVIEFNNKTGNTIKVGSTIKITISKGILKMIKFTDVATFEEWAIKNEINYTIDYEYSTTVSEGKVIKSSHNENDTIKNKDTVSIIISKGSKTVIPNLLGLTLEDAKGACTNASIKCVFDFKDGNTVTKQSMRAGSEVPKDTSVTVTIGK